MTAAWKLVTTCPLRMFVAPMTVEMRIAKAMASMPMDWSLTPASSSAEMYPSQSRSLSFSLSSHLPHLSHRQHLLLTALAASLGIAALFSRYSLFVLPRRKRDERRRELEGDVLQYRGVQDEYTWPLGALYLQMTTNVCGRRCRIRRNYAFFGEESMARIRKARVVVVGCGGVGSWAAVMLVSLSVPFSLPGSHTSVTLSSLNRHATATLGSCVAQTLRDVARWVEVDARVDVGRKDEGDAIDNIQTKVDLLHYCHTHKIPVFSSMGAGAKTDPTRIQIADISNTIYDPLARAVRRRLRLLGVSSGIAVGYSTEVPGDELGVMDDWRVRVLPVLGPLPAVFGLNAATYVLAELVGKPIPNPLAVKNRRKVYERMLRDLQARKNRRAGGEPGMVTRLRIDEDDVALIFEDIHRGRSVIRPHPVPVRPTLVRWNPSEGLTLENVVLMEYKEAAKHEAGVYGYVGDTKTESGLDLWGAQMDALVQKRREEARRVTEWVDW
ncbi:ubiquitin-protein ligase molybdopterin-converting factor [Mycena amicta]|nr:ubiquitin-protein ligase molybdopterin-converting factor [Mycena amicta]